MPFKSSTHTSWMTTGSIVSGVLHCVALVLVIWGLPVFSTRDDSIAEPPSIEVALISDKSNPPPALVPNLKAPRSTEVKPETVTPPSPKPQVAPQPEDVKPEVVKPKVEPLPPKPKPPEMQQQQAATPPEPTPTPPQDKPKEPETPISPVASQLAQVRPRSKPTPPKEPPKPTKPASDFDELVKNVEKMDSSPRSSRSDQQPSPDQKPSQTQAAAGAPNHNPTKPLSMSEKDAIKAQISKNWNLDAGAKDLDKIQVLLRISMDQDGTVRDVTLAEPGQMNNPVYRAVAESAIRAVRLSSPLTYPVQKYDSFREFELLVKPGDALNRR